MANPHQEHGLTHGIGGVFALDHGLGHSREAREFIDHPPDVVDLPHDRLGTLLEHRFVFGNHLAEFAADAFGRELNRRQRIFNFMSDPPGNVRPRGLALC